ncbi:MAG TPA: hypothetical protein PLQ19_06590 [Aeromicrobium sp.]|nr:hypothetical protein [Aeromicrobium sp.]
MSTETASACGVASPATSSFEDNVADSELLINLHPDEFWNPWRIEEKPPELERTQQIMEHWERTWSNFRRNTKRQLEAEMARWGSGLQAKAGAS